MPVAPLAFDRGVRAVKGVGAPIMDFFGVSVTFLLLLLERLEDDGAERAASCAFLLPAVTKGWRIAA